MNNTHKAEKMPNPLHYQFQLKKRTSQVQEMPLQRKEYPSGLNSHFAKTLFAKNIINSRRESPSLRSVSANLLKSHGNVVFELQPTVRIDGSIEIDNKYKDNTKKVLQLRRSSLNSGVNQPSHKVVKRMKRVNFDQRGIFQPVYQINQMNGGVYDNQRGYLHNRVPRLVVSELNVSSGGSVGSLWRSRSLSRQILNQSHSMNHQKQTQHRGRSYENDKENQPNWQIDQNVNISQLLKIENSSQKLNREYEYLRKINLDGSFTESARHIPSPNQPNEDKESKMLLKSQVFGNEKILSFQNASDKYSYNMEHETQIPGRIEDQSGNEEEFYTPFKFHTLRNGRGLTSSKLGQGSSTDFGISQGGEKIGDIDSYIDMHKENYSSHENSLQKRNVPSSDHESPSEKKKNEGRAQKFTNASKPLTCLQSQESSSTGVKMEYESPPATKNRHSEIIESASDLQDSIQKSWAKNGNLGKNMDMPIHQSEYELRKIIKVEKIADFQPNLKEETQKNSPYKTTPSKSCTERVTTQNEIFDSYIDKPHEEDKGI